MTNTKRFIVWPFSFSLLLHINPPLGLKVAGMREGFIIAHWSLPSPRPEGSSRNMSGRRISYEGHDVSLLVKNVLRTQPPLCSCLGFSLCLESASSPPLPVQSTCDLSQQYIQSPRPMPKLFPHTPVLLAWCLSGHSHQHSFCALLLAWYV